MQTFLDWAIRSRRWLLPVGALLALAGYFGPWIGHAAAGLVVTGLDMGEYVKFLPAIINGVVSVWRQGFYLPLLAVSLATSTSAFRAEFCYGWPMRVLLLAVAIIAALNMLPPAWTPQRMLTPEFRLQAAAIGVCLLAVAFSPMLALLPDRLVGAVIVVLALAAIWFPIQGFLHVLPDISLIYNRPQSASWGPYVMTAGLTAIVVVSLVPWITKSTSIGRSG